MIVEDAQIIPNSSKFCLKTVSQIFQDPQQRQRILKIIIQTLYNLGYEQSAAELEAQSKITYFSQQVKSVKAALAEQKYEKVEKILNKSKKFDLVKSVVYELKCLKLIRDGKIEDALLLIQNEINDPKKQAELSEELMMGTGQIKAQIIKKKHEHILQKCFDHDISPNSMGKMISSFIELQKKGLTKNISPEFSLLKKPSTCRRPPMRIIQTYTSKQLKNISFIKFNRKQTKLVVVSSIKKQKIILLWKLDKIKQQLFEYKSASFEITEDIINISWNHDEEEMIALTTHSQIIVLNSSLKVIKKRNIIPQSPSNRILTLNWNHFKNYLYVGGSFENIKVYSHTLEDIICIQPFIRTRIIQFNNEGTMMYAISATKPQFVYYNLFENKQEGQFLCEDIITSFRLVNQDRNIVLVTQKKIVYIQVQFEKTNKYQTLHTFDNIFSENGLVQIQASLFYPYIVCMGQRQFQALAIQADIPQQHKWNSKDSFTFDSCDGFMVSGTKELYLWGSGAFLDVMQQEEESEMMQGQQSLNSDNENEEDDEEQGNEQDDFDLEDIESENS